MALIRILERRNFDEDSLTAKASPLVFGRRNRGPLVRIGIVAGSEKGKQKTSCDPHHQEAMEVINEIQKEALRVLSIIAPEDDPLFELWLAETLEHTKTGSQNSIGEDAMRLLGKRLSGIKVSTNELIKELEELRGEKIGKDNLNNLLARIRTRTEGNKFELKTGYEPAEHGGHRSYHWIVSNSEGHVDEELLKQKIWAARMAIPGKTGDRDENMRIITDTPKNTRISTDYMIEVRGLKELEVQDPETVRNKIQRSMSATINRIENSTLEFAREFTIRRLRTGGGSQAKVEFVLMDRAESIKNWLEKMNAKPDSVKFRVLKKMFEFNLDTEFTSEQLVELLTIDGFSTNSRMVNKTLAEILQKSEKTEYELAKRKDGHSTYHKIKI